MRVERVRSAFEKKWIASQLRGENGEPEDISDDELLLMFEGSLSLEVANLAYAMRNFVNACKKVKW